MGMLAIPEASMSGLITVALGNPRSVPFLVDFPDDDPIGRPRRRDGFRQPIDPGNSVAKWSNVKRIIGLSWISR